MVPQATGHVNFAKRFGRILEKNLRNDAYILYIILYVYKNNDIIITYNTIIIMYDNIQYIIYNNSAGVSFQVTAHFSAPRGGTLTVY